jgi:hypothetical protein
MKRYKWARETREEHRGIHLIMAIGILIRARSNKKETRAAHFI